MLSRKEVFKQNHTFHKLANHTISLIAGGTRKLRDYDLVLDTDTKREIIQAQAARSLQQRLANPPDQKLSDAISKVSPADIAGAQKIYGPNALALQGRTVTRTALPLPIPQESLRDTFAQ